MYFLQNMLSSLTSGIFSVVWAALILIVAFFVAGLVKSLVLKVLGKGKFSDFLAKFDPEEGKAGSTKEIIGKLVYLIVFLLFVPSIFAKLGMSEVSSPIVTLLNTIWGYVPNIVAAVIVLVVGFLIARLVRQILIPIFAKLNVDKLQEKAGIEVTSSDKLSNTLAYIVYVLILIPMIVMALDVLNIDVISDPAVHMLNIIFGFIPNILVGLVIIIIGCYIAKFVGQIVTRLIASAGLDNKVTKLLDSDKQKFVLSKFVGILVQVIVIISFVVEGVNVLQLKILTDIGAVIINYIPAVLSAVVILAISYFASSIVEKALRKNGFEKTALVAKAVIIILGAFMILSQLGIASVIVNSAFKLVLAALAVAFALAFGIGGKEFAANSLKKLEDKMESKEDK